MAYQLISSVTTSEGQTYAGTATEITASAEAYGSSWYASLLLSPSLVQAEFGRQIRPYGVHLLRLDIYEDWEMMPEAVSEFPTEPMFDVHCKLVAWVHASPGLPVALVAALPAIISGVITIGILFFGWILLKTAIEGIKDIIWGEQIPGQPGKREGGIAGLAGGLGGVVIVGVAAVGGILLLSKLLGKKT